jgi:hypothetical protein
LTANRFQAVEEQTATLQRIANAYGVGSAEESTLRLAAFALLFVVMQHPDEFDEFIQGKELTAEQRAHLESLGLRY